MALSDFKPQFDNSYQEVFLKTLVAKEIANTRFESVLKFGESVERVAFDISGVQVRDVVRGSASTIDSVTDTSELLKVNIEKEAVFHISDGEVKQAGPFNPGEVIGGKIARKVAISLDGRVFAETMNAEFDFDNGDLTTGASTGTPITLSSTTVPQLTTRMSAKLQYKNNQDVMSNMCLVVDPYSAADIAQYLLGKSIDLAGSVFKNGYTDVVNNAKMYVSNNLTGEAVLGMAAIPSDNNTVVINGVTFTFQTTLGATAGNVLISGTADLARANLAALINTPGTTTATGVALSAADQAILRDTTGLVSRVVTTSESTDTTYTAATNNNTADTLTIVGVGSGAMVVSATFTTTSDSWSKNFVHAYYGKKGGIDLVVQDLKEVDMRPTADRRGTNVFSSYLAGVRTFADGKKKFLDVLINKGV
jgi:hypothetical protein